MRMLKTVISVVALMSLAAGCATAPKSDAAKEDLSDSAGVALKRFYREDPDLKAFIDTSAGYVVFPEVGKGGLVVGGTYGRGIVYQGETAIGYADMSKVSVGATVGGQTFAEVIVFQNALALNDFKNGKLAFAADASAVALKSGGAASAKYNNGVAVFVDNRGGLMADASVGGQKFTFVPIEK
ncbi:MAG: hypothetical protein QM754_05555 [Tepidisphaeraceae bacterium]